MSYMREHRLRTIRKKVMEKILFLNTYENYHTNGANRSYWSKFFKTLVEVTGEKNKMRLNSSFNENMPIYEYYSEEKGRFVRVMQYNPKDEVIKSEKYDTSRFYTAWLDKRELYIKEDNRNVQKPELVVCLLMTAGNIDKAEKLIRIWLFGENEGRVMAEIDKIYDEQDRMDKKDR